MGLLKRLVTVILVAVVLIALVISCAFVLGDSWFPGGLPTLLVSACTQYWIAALVGLIVVLIIRTLINKTTLNKLLVLGSIVALGVTAFGVYEMVSVLNKYGGNVDILKCNRLYNVSSVMTDDVEYAQGIDGPLELTVYHTEGDARDKPIIFYTHGGGWISLGRNERSYDCKVLALAGFVVVSWDYDLSTDEVHLWDKVEGQALEALTWVRDNIAAYGGSTERFYMIGDSAGGQITLDVAFKVNGGIYRASDGGWLPAVDAICCNYPVASPTAFWDYDGMLLASTGQEMVEKYIGATPSEVPERVVSIEPSLYIAENMPPALFMVPEDDSLVPPEASYDLVKLLKERGATAAALRVPNANHAFDVLPGSLGDQAWLSYVYGWCNYFQ